MQFQSADVIRLTNDIWASMLGMELAPCERVDLGSSEQVIASSVDITGDWQGRIRLDCSSRLAREAAARFVGADPAEISSEQVRDALSELTNMTAGSVKSLLSCTSRLTIPSMDTSAPPAPASCDQLLQSGFMFEGEPLLVTIIGYNGRTSPPARVTE